jgi:hypothetical protein
VPDPMAERADPAGTGHVIDPTKNVLELVEGEVKRLDDLRGAYIKWMEAEIAHVKEMITLRAAHAQEIQRIETERLASIRQVDVLHQSSAAERQQAAILSLERIVDSTAKTLATQNTNMMTVVEARLAALERSSYEGKGKQTVVDPMMEKLVMQMASLAESRSQSTGRSGGLQSGWSWIIGAVGLIAGLIGIFAALSQG